MNNPLLSFLIARGYPSAHSLQLLGAGMFSQAYRFETDDGICVLRIGVTREAFEKDQLAYERLGSVAPIPKIVAIGDYDQTQSYCISKYKTGRMLTALSRTEIEQLLPSLFDTMLAMSRIALPADTEFGILNGKGQARKSYQTWAKFIGAVDDFWATCTPRGDEVYRPWKELYDRTFLDEQLVQDARQRLTDLLPLLPNERHYVHGDFGFDNALADANQLSAILDWAEMRCGDWLYDLAYLIFNDDKQIDYLKSFEQFMVAKNLSSPNVRERVQAYLLHIFLGSVFLEANRNMRDWYDEDVERYKRLILHAD